MVSLLLMNFRRREQSLRPVCHVVAPKDATKLAPGITAYGTLLQA